MSARLLLAILILSYLVRVLSYLIDRSLWLDEAMLALSISESSYSQLLSGNLARGQAGPPGFLIVEYLFTQAFGMSEKAFRFIPLFSSLASLYVFNKIARKVLGGFGYLPAIALLGLSSSLIYFASETKHYSLDVFATTIIIYFVLLVSDSAKVLKKEWILFGLIGSVLIWFSYTALFVLAGVGLVLFFQGLKERRSIKNIVILGFSWFLSFSLLYHFALSDLSSSSTMDKFWLTGFMPIPPRTLSELLWLPNAYLDLFSRIFVYAYISSPLRIALSLLAAVVALFSVLNWRKELAFLIAPLVVALAASALQVYPFQERLILGFVPIAVLLTALGLEVALEKSKFIASIASLVLVVGAILSTLQFFESPYREELRPVLEKVAKLPPGTTVYVHSGAYHQLVYNLISCESCRGSDFHLYQGAFFGPKASTKEIEHDLVSLKGKKSVVVLFSHLWWGWGNTEKDTILDFLLRQGQPLGSVEHVGASAYLFDMSSEAKVAE